MAFLFVDGLTGTLSFMLVHLIKDIIQKCHAHCDVANIAVSIHTKFFFSNT